MKKLIIIPAYNESQNIKKTVEAIRKDAPQFDYVIINDCSTDNTREICEENGFNLVNLGVCFGIVGITKKYYQSKRNKRLDEITLLNEQIQLVNEQVQEIRKRYDEVYNKSKSIVLKIIKEEKDIEKIKQAIVNALLKASNRDLEVLNPILDNLIEKEISSSEQPVIDTDINRNRSLD